MPRLNVPSHLLYAKVKDSLNFSSQATLMNSNDHSATPFEEATYLKVTWRLIPLLLLCYIVAYLDRVNVGFAKLQMAGELGFSDAVYGLGAGMFFIG
jgi:sugar phosphate permease